MKAHQVFIASRAASYSPGVARKPAVLCLQIPLQICTPDLLDGHKVVHIACSRSSCHKFADTESQERYHSCYISIAIYIELIDEMANGSKQKGTSEGILQMRICSPLTMSKQSREQGQATVLGSAECVALNIEQPGFAGDGKLLRWQA